jgi:hypothetical protein
MVLAGLALAAAVWAAWPEPTTRVVRLPYGEAAPKTPRVAAPAPREAAEAPAAAEATSVPAPVAPEPAPDVAEQPVAEEETARVLAAVEPAPAPAAPTTEQVEDVWGPDPVPSELDGDPGYEPEPPEELGAAPLPGFDVTPPAPPVAG